MREHGSWAVDISKHQFIRDYLCERFPSETFSHCSVGNVRIELECTFGFAALEIGKCLVKDPSHDCYLVLHQGKLIINVFLVLNSVFAN